MSEQTRREFLRSCFRIGGYAGIACLGMGAVEDARGWGILPAIITGGPAGDSPWADWDATTEAGIATDNRFAIFGEGGNSANETGQGGGLAGADLVWTQTGAMPGNGTYRDLAGTNQYFYCTTGFRDFSAGATEYGFMWNVENWNPAIDYETIIRWGAANNIQLRRKLKTVLYLDIQGGGGETVNTPGTAVRLYLYVGCNGADTRFGFTSSGSGAGGQPSKWSDFAANDRVSLGAAYPLTTWNEAIPLMFTDSAAETTRECVLRFYWSVFCNNDSLIDFAA